MERKKIEWKTTVAIFFTYIFVILVLLFFVNFLRAQNNKAPIFCFAGVSEDTRVHNCFGYRVIRHWSGSTWYTQIGPLWMKPDKSLDKEEKITTRYLVPNDFNTDGKSVEEQVEKFLKENVDPDFDFDLYQLMGKIYFFFINGVKTQYTLYFDSEFVYDPETGQRQERVTKIVYETSDIKKSVEEVLKNLPKGYDQKKERIVKKFLREHPELTYVSDNYVYYSKSLHVNITTVNKDGKEENNLEPLALFRFKK